MVCNTQNYWVFGHCPSSGRKHKVSETLFPPSGEEGVTYSVGLLRKRLATSKGTNRVDVFPLT
jgi:hypothetical protein